MKRTTNKIDAPNIVSTSLIFILYYLKANLSSRNLIIARRVSHNGAYEDFSLLRYNFV
jgi:hypothetical protein